MDSKQIVDMYSYICEKGSNGTTVKRIMETFGVKKKEVISFLDILSKYDGNIDFYYASPEENEFFDEIKDINENIIIEVQDNFKGIVLKLDILESIKIYECFEDSSGFKDIKKKFLTQIGHSSMDNFKYITKGIVKSEVEEKTAKCKSEVVKCILNNLVMDFTYYSREKNEKDKLFHVVPLGIYFDEFKKTWFFVGRDKETITNYRLDRILEINKTEERTYSNKKIKEQEDFSIDKFLNSNRKVEMVLKVFDEANVVDKIKNIFNNYKLTVEDYESYKIISIKVEDSVYFKPLLDSFGDSVVVIKPEGLRGRIIDDTNELLKRYENLSMEVKKW